MVNRRQFGAGWALLAGMPSWARASGAAGKLLPQCKLLLGAPPGGSGDLLARRLADRMRGDYADTVLVENKAGAGGQLAILAMKESAADGSTLLLTPSSLLSIYPHTYRHLRYDAARDLSPVSLAAWSNHAFGVGPSVPESVRTLEEFLAWSRSRGPGGASFGSPASGAIPHLIGVVIGKRSNTPLRHIPYKGSAQALTDLRGGQLDAHSGPLGAFLPLLSSGQVRLLAVSGDARSRLLPDVPTYRELGFGISAREWYGFFLPANAAPDVVARAAGSLNRAMGGAEMGKALSGFGLEPAQATPAELAHMLRADGEEWRDLIKAVGFTAES